MYLPVVVNARLEKRFRVGPYVATLVTDCQMPAQTMIQYRHILLVSQAGDPMFQPFFAVASEISRMIAELIPDKRNADELFLGIFPGSGHMNMGMSTDWADIEKFTAKALAIVQDHFGVTEAPQELPLKAIEKRRIDPYEAYRMPPSPPKNGLGSQIKGLFGPKDSRLN